MKLKSIFIVVAALVLLGSCGEPDPTREQRPDTYADPGLTFEGQEDVIANGISALVEGQITFKFTAKAEAGLVALLLNDENVRSFTHGQLTETFNYNFIMPDIQEVILNFALKDEQGRKVTIPPLKVTAEGKIPDVILIADMQGEFIETQTENINFPSGQGGSLFQDKASIQSDVDGFEYAYPRFITWFTPPLVSSDGILAYHQSDPAGGEEYCLKITKPGNAFNMQIRFDGVIPEFLINDIIDGKRELQMDIYIDNNVVPGANNNIMLALANFATFKNDATGMINKKLSWHFTAESLKKWTEATFIDEGVGNVGPSGWTTNDKVDMLVLKPTMNQAHGPYYIKNIRIVKKEE